MEKDSERKPFMGGRGRGGTGRGGAAFNRSKSRGFENRENNGSAFNNDRFQNKSRGRMNTINNDVNERFESRNRKFEGGAARGRNRDQSQASEKRDMRPANFIRDIE